MKIDTIGSWYPNHPFLMVPPFYLLCGQWNANIAFRPDKSTNGRQG
jgi:hypothetical protein